MRSIGQLPNQARARAFGDFLLVQGIDNEIEGDAGGAWTIWVHDDDHLDRARTLLAEFQLDPDNPKYRQAAPDAQSLRAQERREQRAWARRFFDRGSLWRGATWRVGGLTASLVALCVAVGLYEMLRGWDDPFIRALFITDNTVVEGLVHFERGLPEIRSGQLWRLVTPIFLHFGPLHLLFNGLWLLDLASQIEARRGAGRLALLMVMIAAVSNLAQYSVGHPRFGGMSGVVYGLFGYIWVRGKLDPRSGLFLDPTTVGLMIIWFVVCMTGWVGPIANMAHATGLGLGVVCGFLSAKFSRDV